MRDCVRGRHRRGEGRQHLREGDGIPVGARRAVPHVEHERDRTLPRRRRQEAKRRAVLRLERGELAGDRAQWTEHDGEARRAGSPRAEQLVAQRRVPIAARSNAGRRRPARDQLALERLVDGLGQTSAPRRPDALELGHDHPGALELDARRVALAFRGEHDVPGQLTSACARRFAPHVNPLGQRLVLHRDGKMYARGAAIGPLSCAFLRMRRGRALTERVAMLCSRQVPSAGFELSGFMDPYIHEPGVPWPLGAHAGPTRKSRITRKP